MGFLEGFIIGLMTIPAILGTFLILDKLGYLKKKKKAPKSDASEKK